MLLSIPTYKWSKHHHNDSLSKCDLFALTQVNIDLNQWIKTFYIWQISIKELIHLFRYCKKSSNKTKSYTMSFLIYVSKTISSSINTFLFFAKQRTLLHKNKQKIITNASLFWNTSRNQKHTNPIKCCFST